MQINTQNRVRQEEKQLYPEVMRVGTDKTKIDNRGNVSIHLVFLNSRK